MRAAILAALQADATLMALLPGGMHTATEISRLLTPAAFDTATKELLPCGLLRLSSETPTGPALALRAALSVYEIYLYERVGSAAIEPARKRIYSLLHLQRIAPATGGAWTMIHANDIPDRDESTLDASLCITRYAARHTSH
jgi:hypothetical protein